MCFRPQFTYSDCLENKSQEFKKKVSTVRLLNQQPDFLDVPSTQQLSLSNFKEKSFISYFRLLFFGAKNICLSKDYRIWPISLGLYLEECYTFCREFTSLRTCSGSYQIPFSYLLAFRGGTSNSKLVLDVYEQCLKSCPSLSSPVQGKLVPKPLLLLPLG